MLESFGLTGLRNWRKLSEFQVPKCKDCQHTNKLVSQLFAGILCNKTFLNIFFIVPKDNVQVHYGKKILKNKCFLRVEKILKGNSDLIPSPSPSLKIQIMGRKVCLIIPQVNFSVYNLHWWWWWLDWIQTTFLNIFYFKGNFYGTKTKKFKL